METNKALCDVVSSRKPAYTKSVIKLALKSLKGRTSIWIIVEDVDDKMVYEKFFISDNVNIFISEDETGRKGYSRVQSIVAEIKAEEHCDLIFGIRDADYEKYTYGWSGFPASIYATDSRDIEMMMMKSQSVKSALAEWNPKIPDTLIKLKPVARKLGYVRICNQIRDLGCTFRDNVKIHSVWNEKVHELYPEWETMIMEMFIRGCKKNFTTVEYDQIVLKLQLDGKSIYDVSRGHDVLTLLQYMLINTQIYNSKSIMRKMSDSYSIKDFKTTDLYKSILQWSKARNVNILL